MLVAREPAESLGRAGAEHHAALDVAIVEPARAALEQDLGLVFGEQLAVAFDVCGVAHVGKRQLDSRIAEQPPERQRVVVAGSVVVGDDRAWFHGAVRGGAGTAFGASIASACYQG